MTENTKTIAELLGGIADTLFFLAEDLPCNRLDQQFDFLKTAFSQIADDLESDVFLDWVRTRDGYTIWRFNLLKIEIEDLELSLRCSGNSVNEWITANPNTYSALAYLWGREDQMRLNWFSGFESTLNSIEMDWLFLSRWIGMQIPTDKKTDKKKNNAKKRPPNTAACVCAVYVMRGLKKDPRNKRKFLVLDWIHSQNGVWEGKKISWRSIDRVLQDNPDLWKPADT